MGQWAKAHFFFGLKKCMGKETEQIRALAERVAASHGLEVVDLEVQGGGGKHRTLRIFLERNAEGRAELERRLAALRAEAEHDSAPEANRAENLEGAIVLDLVDAGEAAGLTEEEDELAYLRELPDGVPVAQLSGVTHGDCERFSRDFGVVLDVEDLMPGAEYTLEASSPGLDRKLRTPEEFARFAGQLCKLQLFTPVEGNRHWQGRLGGVADGRLTLHPPPPKAKKKGAKPGAEPPPVAIALANIEKAQLAPEF